MLQVGGVQEAITLAPPPLVVVTAPAVLTPTVPGCEELQVKGTPVIGFPKVSSTVAVTVFPVPEVTLMELVLLPVTVNAIDSTAQVVKSRVWLVTLLRLAKIAVMPGVFAVTCSCPLARPVTGARSVAVLSVATSVVIAVHVKGPTVEVMSRPWLKAEA